jgi:hypothetical protein
VAELTKSGLPSLSTTHPCPAHRPTGLKAGEDIAAGDFVYVKTDGLLWRATGAAANAAALAIGMAAAAAKAGEACTPLHGVYANYGSGLTPGTRYYISGTVPGGLADAASTGGTVPVAYAWDATQIYIFNPGR